MPPFRFRLTRAVCRWLPPILASRVRSWLYPMALAYRDDFEFVTRAQTGSRFQGPISDHHAYGFSMQGYYDWRVWSIAAAYCRGGDTVVEVGANIGTESVAFADLVGNEGRVVCFEPVPDNFQILEENIALNQYSHVSAYAYAVGAQETDLFFSIPPEHKSGSAHVIGSGGGEVGDQAHFAVRCVTLDSFEPALENVRLIQADVEGSEVSVIRGGRAIIERDHPAMILEVSAGLLEQQNSSVNDLAQLLDELSYVAFRINRWGLSPVGPDEIVHRGAMNWLCVHQSDAKDIRRVQSVMNRSYVMPCLPGLNPLTRWSRR